MRLILFVILLIVIIVIVYLLIIFNSGDDPSNYSDNENNRVILYSYGLFSNDPMSDSMKEMINSNSEITKMPYFVIDAKEIISDLKEMECIIIGITYAYNSVPRGVGKSDIARLVSLYIRGGHYADLDVQFKKIPPIKKNTVVLYTEIFSIKDNDFVRIANYALSSPPKHKFIYDVLTEIVKRVGLMYNKISWTDKDVLNTTGPDVITSVYHKQSDSSVIRLSFIKSHQILKHKQAGSWRNQKDTI